MSMEDSRTEDWTLNSLNLVWVDFHKRHQIELIVINNLSNGGRLVMEFSSKPKKNNLVFHIYLKLA